MSIRTLKIIVLFVIALLFFGCMTDRNSPNTGPNGNGGAPVAIGSDTRWSQYHGDLSSRGFQLKPTRDAITPLWSTIVGQATVSSPVLGRDNANRDTLYIGTIDGKLVALDTINGNVKWQVRISNASGTFITTPAVAPNGDIIFTTNRGRDTGGSTILHKVTPNGNLVWSFDFSGEFYTSGSPKVLRDEGGRTLIFLYGYAKDTKAGELFVLEDKGNRVPLLDRKFLIGCPIVGNSGFLDFLKEIWDFLPPNEFDASNTLPPGPNSPFFILDPTIAILKERNRIDIAVVDNFCSIGAFSWKDGRLEKLWSRQHNRDLHASPTILTNDLMVYGRHDGKLIARDFKTGNKVWVFDAGERIVGPPSVPLGQFVFVLSEKHLTVINSADGRPIIDNGNPRRRTFRDEDKPNGYAVVSTRHVHVQQAESLKSYSFDLRSIGHDQISFKNSFMSGPAIGDDGSLYVVHWNFLNGSFQAAVRKYP